MIKKTDSEKFFLHPCVLPQWIENLDKRNLHYTQISCTPVLSSETATLFPCQWNTESLCHSCSMPAVHMYTQTALALNLLATLTTGEWASGSIVNISNANPAVWLVDNIFYAIQVLNVFKCWSMMRPHNIWNQTYIS